MRYCVNCGAALKPAGNFCDSCGCPVKRGESPAPDQTSAAIPQPTSIGIASAPGASTGTNAVRITAVVVLVGFLMPWISCQGLTGRETASGIELAGRGAPGLWIVPVSMLIALGVLIIKNKSVRERATAGKVAMGAGVASLLVMLYYYATLNGAGQRDEFGFGAVVRQSVGIEIGAILSLLGSIGVAIGGFLHLHSASAGNASITGNQGG